MKGFVLRGLLSLFSKISAYSLSPPLKTELTKDKIMNRDSPTGKLEEISSSSLVALGDASSRRVPDDVHTGQTSETLSLKDTYSFGNGNPGVAGVRSIEALLMGV